MPTQKWWPISLNIVYFTYVRPTAVENIYTEWTWSRVVLCKYINNQLLLMYILLWDHWCFNVQSSSWYIIVWKRKKWWYFVVTFLLIVLIDRWTADPVRSKNYTTLRSPLFADVCSILIVLLDWPAQFTPSRCKQKLIKYMPYCTLLLYA